MDLIGRKVKIVVDEPWDWKENIFGTIISHKEKTSILVQLTIPIKGKIIESDHITLTPRYVKKTFKPLSINCPVTVGGSLVKKGSGEFEYLIIGHVNLI